MSRHLVPRRRAKLTFWILFFCCVVTSTTAQDTLTNLNTYYQFPLSVGFGYEALSPFAEYGALYNTFDLSANVRLPIPRAPVIQPIAELGMMRFDNQDPAEARWDHSHWYGALGAAYSHRFVKYFEVAAEGLVGFSAAYFRDLLPELGTVTAPYFLMEAGARISLNPSFNFSIDIHPSLKWLVALHPLKDFNGLLLGVGFSAAYRFGQDPDAPTAVIRSIHFEDADIPELFAAMQSYYVRNPIGSVSLTNTDRSAVRNLMVSFFQAGYMDSPTQVASISELAPGESLRVDLVASFNAQVFALQGITPLTGEVIVTYQSGGRSVEQRHSVSYDLYDKTSLTWTDDRKVAAYITPADSALRNYTSFIRQTCKDEVIPTYNRQIQDAMQIYNALGVIGCLYQADPSIPFTTAKGDPQVVDSINLPRETLSRITGDCDDLTVLFCSLLETVGVETGFITVPGHIYAAFNTEIPAREYAQIHPNRAAAISFEGTLWIPVEITLIGQSGFLEAWQKGAEEWVALNGSPQQRVLLRTRAAQELYRPVGLTETDLGLQYGSPERLVADFCRDRDALADIIVGEHLSRAQETGRTQDFNRLGIAYARLGLYGDAEETFRQCLDMDPHYVNARINLGSLFYSWAMYDEALSTYRAAMTELANAGQGDTTKALRLHISMSKTFYELGRFEEAERAFELAKEIDEEEAEEFSYLARASDGGARASDVLTTQGQVIFVGEEE